MERTEFDRRLADGGYVAVPKQMAPGEVVADHSHPWDVCALVTAGDITLTIGGTATVYATGDVFTMDAGCVHHEVVGPDGVHYLAGRREPADGATHD
jgi:quercetin dioxygenase-like cupin family protein